MKAARLQRGFSLGELMIALTLGALVSAAFISLFIGFRSASGTGSGTAAIADHGRYALTFLQQAVRTAGYYACGDPTQAAYTISTSTPTTTLYYNFTQPMVGFEAKNTSPGGSVTMATTAALDSTVTDWALPAATAQPSPYNALTTLFGDTSGAIKGNDILVVHGAPIENQPTTTPIFVSNSGIVAGSTSFTVQPAPGSVFAVNQLAAVSDCGRATVVFQIAPSSSLGTGGEGIASSTATIKTDSGGNGALNSVWSIPFAGGAEVSMVDTAAYYIGVGEDGDGALFRASLLQTPAGSNAGVKMTAVELVPDIEAMQILYGLDPTGVTDTTGGYYATEYVTADQVPNFLDVVSVKIGLLASSSMSSGSNVGASAVGVATSSATHQAYFAPKTYSLLGTTVTVPGAVDQTSGPRLRQVFEISIAAHNVLN